MMQAPEDQILIAVLGKNIYVRPVGYATQRNSLGIPDFLDAMFRAGCMCAVFDLRCCEGMDSTFLGVVADAATALPHRQGKTVVILNANERAERQLQRVGLIPLVCMSRREVELPADVELSEIDFLHFPKTDLQRLQKIRDLHERLVGVNAGNRELFGSFIEMLDAELRRDRGREPGD